ncbi:MAG TPA: hypothetical protein VIH86_18005 [Puia sp.]|jgi:hypothetical protein
MNARNYRVSINHALLEFLPIEGLGESSVSYQSEPFLKSNKMLLKITKKYIITDVNHNKEYEVLSVNSVYEIPPNEIKSREDVYEFYKDATMSLNEAYHYIRTQSPALPRIQFPNEPIENYINEIDRVFNLLNSQN